MLNERKLTARELEKRENTLHSLKKNKSTLVKKYGKGAEKVMYGIATKQAKKKVENMNLDNIKEMVKSSLKEFDQGYRGNEFIFILLNDNDKKVKVKAPNSTEAYNKLVAKLGKGLDPMLYSIDGKKLKGFGGIEPKADQDFDEEFDETLDEEIGDSFSTGQSLIRKKTPEMEKKVEVLKSKYPELDIKFISNNDIARARGRNDLIGTFTLSYSFKKTSPQQTKDIEDSIDNIQSNLKEDHTTNTKDKYVVKFSKENNTYQVWEGDELITDFATEERAKSEAKRLNALEDARRVDKAQVGENYHKDLPNQRPLTPQEKELIIKSAQKLELQGKGYDWDQDTAVIYFFPTYNIQTKEYTGPEADYTLVVNRDTLHKVTLPQGARVARVLGNMNYTDAYKSLQGVNEDLDVGHQDNEPHMLKKDLYRIAKYSAELYKMMDKYDLGGEVDFPHWWQAKITKARDMIISAKHYLDGEEKVDQIDNILGLNSVEEIYMGNKGDEVMISKGGKKDNPHYVLEKPDGSKQLNMTFSSPENAKEYAIKKGIKLSSKKGYNMEEIKELIKTKLKK